MYRMRRDRGSRVKKKEIERELGERYRERAIRDI